jgi:hypothetical protein
VRRRRRPLPTFNRLPDDVAEMDLYETTTQTTSIPRLIGSTSDDDAEMDSSGMYTILTLEPGKSRVNIKNTRDCLFIIVYTHCLVFITMFI